MPAHENYWNRELETLPWNEVEAWQRDRIETFVNALPARSAFYADKLRDAPARLATFASLRDLPFTTKDELRRAQSDTSSGRPLGRNQGAPLTQIVQVLSSSGTTGDPMYYALTANDLRTWTDTIAQTYFTAGLRADDVIAHLVGTPIFAGGLPYADAFRRIGATLAWLGGLPTEKIMTAIPRLSVTAILATTSFGTYLADRFGGVDARSLGVRKYMSGGEPGLGQPEIRERIRRGWDLTHIREVMGLGDVMAALWSECEVEDGMHFNGQRSVAVELIEPDTGRSVPWAPDARGEAVYTTFAREATPVLRYRSADHLHVIDARCACGRTAPRVRCIGRTDDMLIYKGMNVFASGIRQIVLEGFSNELEPYLRIWKEHAGQVRYDEPIPVEIEHRADLDPVRIASLSKAIEDRARQRLQVRLSITLVPPGTLPRSSYKTALIQVRP